MINPTQYNKYLSQHGHWVKYSIIALADEYDLIMHIDDEIGKAVLILKKYISNICE